MTASDYVRPYSRFANPAVGSVPTDWLTVRAWRPYLHIKASSYSPRVLFEEVTGRADPPPDPDRFKPGEFVDSPSGKWRYAHLRLPGGTTLETWQGPHRGAVTFDGDVTLPAVYERKPNGKFRGFDCTPWMSLTPAEILTQIPGLELAKGHTVVAGLGLGHLLIEACNKPGVERVTLVEIDAELVEWLLPRARKFIRPGAALDVTVGDAREVLPTLRADVALVDIFPDYGSDNRERTAEIRAACGRRIRKVWGWGVV